MVLRSCSFLVTGPIPRNALPVDSSLFVGYVICAILSVLIYAYIHTNSVLSCRSWLQFHYYSWNSYPPLHLFHSEGRTDLNRFYPVDYAFRMWFHLEDWLMPFAVPNGAVEVSRVDWI